MQEAKDSEKAMVDPGNSSWDCQSMQVPPAGDPSGSFSQPPHLLTGNPWKMHSSSLNLRFSICKMGMIVIVCRSWGLFHFSIAV